MRRLIVLLALLLAIWFVPPGLLSAGSMPALSARVHEPLALVWLLLTLAVTAAWWLRLGWEWSRIRQSGRRSLRSLLPLLAALALLWLAIPLLDSAQDPLRPPLVTIQLINEDAARWLLFSGLISPLLLFAVGWRWQRLHAQGEQTKQVAALVREHANEGIALIDAKLRLHWANEAAREQIAPTGQLDQSVRALIQRAHDTRRVAAQSITIQERRIHVQASPLDDGLTSLISRPQNNDSGPVEFYERFMRRIVHDMRNPLAAIIAHASNLQTGSESDRAVTAKTAATIETEAQRLTRLVDSILFEARLSHMPLTIERFDLLDVLEEVYYQHDERAERERKTIEIESPPLPPWKPTAICWCVR